MSVLQQFFQISLVLTFILLGVNTSIAIWGLSLTGQNITGLEIDLNATADLNTLASNIIEQTATTPSATSIDTTNSETINGFVIKMVAGWQILLLYIFLGIDPSLALMPLLIIVPITFVQIAGIAYLIFAIISLFFGGGQP